MVEKIAQLAPAFLQLLDDAIAPPLPSKFDGAFSLAGMIAVCIPVLQYRNSRAVFKPACQRFLDVGRNDRERQWHAAILLRGE